MNSSLFRRLAWTNIRKNKKIYLPYLLSALFTVVTFFTICTLYNSKSLDTVYGGQNLRQVLMFGSMVIGFFAVIFLFYSNGFLMKQRKKELGLYCILGLEKKHMAKVLFTEMLLSMLISIGGGLIAGTVISKLIFLIMLNLINFDMTLKLQLTVTAYVTTIILFVCIFLATYIKNLLQVHLTNPINLLKGSNQGEREPKASWIMALIGVGTLGYGYYMAVTIKNPVAAMSMFFIAVILVIIGTNLIFTSASIYILKFLKRRKNYYYKPKNFISVSGMIYRMKQNAAGLANICILSTMVIICMLSAVSLYIGQKDIMAQMYPRDIELKADLSTSDVDAVNQMIDDTLAQYDVKPTFRGRFRALEAFGTMDKDQLTVLPLGFNRMGIDDIDHLIGMSIISQDDYNQYTGENIQLNSENDVMVFSASGTYSYDTICLGEQSYHVQDVIKEFNNIVVSEGSMNQAVYIVVKDDDTADKIYRDYVGEDVDNYIKKMCYQYFYLDLDGERDTCIDFENAFVDTLRENEVMFYIQNYHIDNLDWYTTYGGLLFIGVYFGLLFLMATVLIIYYKQITEGYDDRERFNIMQKVGMSKHEVKRTIHKQILMVFTLPLLLAGCHTCFALPMLKRMFQIFNLYNTTLINLCSLATVVLYAIVYGIVYLMTAKAYYKIVEY